MSGDSSRRAFIVFVLTVASLLPALLGAGSDIAEYAKTLKTQDAKCHKDRPGNQVDSPAVKVFAFPGDKPCIMAMMGTQAKIDYVDKNDEDMTTFINIPTNASISGSCRSPQWMSLTWNGQGGGSRTLKIKANSNETLFSEDNIHKYSVEQISFRIAIDEETFPGTLHDGETMTASLDNQQLFESPVNKSFKCKEILLNLKTNDPVGPISITFEDIQFQAYTEKSTFSEGVNCKSTESTDYVAIGIGIFLAASIISALASYAFCQWWRKKDRGS